jgi:ATP-binding cassette, subfamily B, bacterial HlyB/CyaB
MPARRVVNGSAQDPPMSGVAGEVFRELLDRLLQPFAPAAARAIRGRPADATPGSLVELARSRAPLQVARAASVADLARRTGRALCLTDGGRSVLIEALPDGAWRLDTGAAGAPQRVEAGVLDPLFPCLTLFAPRRAAPVSSAAADFSATGPAEAATAVYLRWISQVLGLAMPMAMMLIIDKVVAGGGRNTLVVMVAGVALLTLVQYLFLAAGTLHATRMVELRALGARRQIVDALLRCPDAASWSSVGWEVVAGSAGSLRHQVETRAQCHADVAFVVLLGALMIAFSPLLLAVSAAFVPAYVAVAAWSASRSRRLGAPLAAERNELSAQYFECTAAVDLVRGLDLASYFTDRWHDLDARSAAGRWRLAAVERLSAQAVELLQKCSLLLVMLLGVSSVLDGTMTLGQYIAVNLLSMQLAAPVLRLAAYRRAGIEDALRVEAHRRLLDVCRREAPNSGDLPFPAHPSVVTGRRMTVGAGGARHIDLALRSGAWLGIMGPSGCGKSTLLRALAGLRDPGEGEIRLNGERLERYDGSELARQIRLVTQQPPLFAGTIAGNIRLGDLAAPPQLIVTAAQLCGLGPLLAALPRHLDTPIGAGGRTLSGGEQQRVGIARAILSRPAVLLLDEATSALDPASEAQLLTGLRRYLPRAAVVVVSHRRSSLLVCDEVVDLAAC